MNAKKLVELLNNKDFALHEDTIKSAFAFVWYDACKAMKEELVKEDIIKEGTPILYPSYPKNKY